VSLRLWDEQVLPRLTDVALRGDEVGDLRRRVCAGLSGRVLELGFGSGLNIRYYPGSVTSVTAVEPSDVAWDLSEPRRAASAVPVERGGLDGQHLDLPDASHDTALVTFSLCTIPDPALALREARRVVRPGGRLHVLEHGAADTEGVRRWQRRMEPLQRRLAGGCHLTRDVRALVEANGWRADGLDTLAHPGPGFSRPWTYLYLGTATTS
jgi:ubiquinone/menaquinone biosynthesis C-methylase UbiE